MGCGTSKHQGHGSRQVGQQSHHQSRRQNQYQHERPVPEIQRAICRLSDYGYNLEGPGVGADYYEISLPPNIDRHIPTIAQLDIDPRSPHTLSIHQIHTVRDRRGPEFRLRANDIYISFWTMVLNRRPADLRTLCFMDVENDQMEAVVNYNFYRTYRREDGNRLWITLRPGDAGFRRIGGTPLAKSVARLLERYREMHEDGAREVGRYKIRIHPDSQLREGAPVDYDFMVGIRRVR